MMRLEGPQSVSPSRLEIERVTFLGHFGAGNLGNECTLQAAIERTLRCWPEARLLCACTNPEDVTLRHKIPAVNWKPGPTPPPESEQIQRTGRRWGLTTLLRAGRRIIDELAHLALCIRMLSRNDMLIVCGTGVVCDFLTGPGGWPYDLFKWSTIAALFGSRVLYLGVGVGPINHPVSRWLIKQALGSASYRSYRDEASRRYMETIGFDTTGDVVCPDIAFGLSANLLRPKDDPSHDRPVIGLGLKGLTDTGEANAYRRYVEMMASFVRWLCEQGFDVRLLIGDIPHDKQVTDDVVETLKDGPKLAGRIESEAALTVEQLLNQLNVADLVISPRFHNLVLAGALGKPVIALSDHAKLDSLMAGFGLSEFSLPLGSLDLESLTAAFSRAWHDAERIRVCIRDKTERYREALDEQYGMAFAMVEQNRSHAIAGMPEASGN